MNDKEKLNKIEELLCEYDIDVLNDIFDMDDLMTATLKDIYEFTEDVRKLLIKIWRTLYD